MNLGVLDDRPTALLSDRFSDLIVDVRYRIVQCAPSRSVIKGNHIITGLDGAIIRGTNGNSVFNGFYGFISAEFAPNIKGSSDLNPDVVEPGVTCHDADEPDGRANSNYCGEPREGTPLIEACTLVL